LGNNWAFWTGCSKKEIPIEGFRPSVSNELDPKKEMEAEGKDLNLPKTDTYENVSVSGIL